MKNRPMAGSRRKPKFRVGQVVMQLNGPIKIQIIEFHLYGSTGREQRIYGGQGKWAWEHTLRPLTRREKGSKSK